jgi:two-component system chemotaxis response regulator CheY
MGNILGGTVLIVDDWKTTRAFPIKLCSNLGFERILDADNGKSAWELLKLCKHPVSLVISDWDMPTMSGLELLNRVRAHESLGPTPFILVTALRDVANVKAAIGSGVSSYIVKPFTEETLRSKIEEVLKAAAAKAA